MIVEFNHVKKTLNGKEIIKDLSFQLPSQTMLALLGPNGAGKTTVVRLLMGLYKQDAGEIKLFGQQTSSGRVDLLRQNVGVQNDGNVYEDLTVYDNLAFWCALYDMDKNVANERVDELLAFFNLSEKRNALAGTLSKGMKQKVNLARAIIHKPRLLILDEPNSGLDPVSSAELLELLRNLIQRDNISVIMCTHQLDGLETIADYIGIIKAGSFLRYGSVPDLLAEKWQTTTYTLTVEPIVKAVGICRDFGVAKIVDEHVVVEMPEMLLPDLIEKLVNKYVRILDIRKHEHSIKELYFTEIEED